MPTAPYFSVIVPTRDRSEKLARALRSVTEQTDGDYEIIVVDDGSRDDEAVRIAEIVRSTGNATLIRNSQSLGAPTSRNKAAAAATGRVIALLDSDDWWDPDRLAAHRLVHGDTLACAVSYNPARLVDGTGRVVGYSNKARPDPTVAPATWIAGANCLGGCSSVCVERSAFEAIGGFRPDLPSCQDWDLWLRLVKAGAAIHFVDSVLTFQDCGQHVRISNQRDRVVEGHAGVMAAILDQEWTPVERRYIEARHATVRAWISHSFGDRFEALRLASKAWLTLRDVATAGTVFHYARQLMRS